jgi:hypothetical protein
MARSVLVDLGLVKLPDLANELVPFSQTPGDGTTLCFVAAIPDEIDQLVHIRDVAGILFARRQLDGKYLSHHGIKVTIRALDFPTGDALKFAIANGLSSVDNTTVIVPDLAGVGSPHYLKSIYLVGTPIYLGEEPNKKRNLWTINARVAMQDREPMIG